VLTTNTDHPAREVALNYKRLWMVEDVFRSMKSLLAEPISNPAQVERKRVARPFSKLQPIENG
jgi:IS4 transposase